MFLILKNGQNHGLYWKVSWNFPCALMLRQFASNISVQMELGFVFVS